MSLNNNGNNAAITTLYNNNRNKGGDQGPPDLFEVFNKPSQKLRKVWWWKRWQWGLYRGGDTRFWCYRDYRHRYRGLCWFLAAIGEAERGAVLRQENTTVWLIYTNCALVLS